MNVNLKYPECSVEGREVNDLMRKAVCPALILDKKVVCDAGKEIFHPSSRLIRESCTNELHKLCPLRA
jgi:hypothetical protein